VKLLNLDLLAYGVFSGRQLDFAAHKTGFHVIFGGNESGKSTSLRAFLALLYGVPPRTRDNFLHDSSKLRIGGRLRHSSGKELEFRRRKGNKNTLLDTADSPIDDGLLREFLVGIDRARFEAVFGIDHERLAKGAQAILSGGGDVGESLFSAGVGTANLREVLDKLDAEADDLYRPRGSKPKINSVLSAYKASAKKVRDATLLSGNWSKQRKQLAKLQQQQKELAAKQGKIGTEANRLERLGKVMPKLARRKALLAEQESLGEVVALAADFAERRRTAEQSQRQADRTHGNAERELTVKQAEVSGLDVPEGLIDEAVAVNELYKELGRLRKAKKDATGLEARRKQTRTDAHGLLDELRPEVSLDDVDGIRPKTGTKARVRELAELFQATSAAPTHTKRDVTRCERELKADQDALDALEEQREIVPLRVLVARLRMQGELEATLRNELRSLEDAQEEAALALKGLGSWTGTLQQCEALAVPARETVDHHQEAIREAQSAIKAVAARIVKCDAGLAEQRETVKTLELAGAVLTEADLLEARESRTADWLRIRQAWLGDAAPEGEPVSIDELPGSYESHVEGADEVADRLRREAKRVAKFAALQALRDRLQGQLQQLHSERDEAATHKQNVAAEWTAVWSPLGIEPLTPPEMRSWLDSHGNVVMLAKAARDAGRRVESLQQDIGTLRDELSVAFEALSESAVGPQETLSASLDRADLIVQMLTEAARQRAELSKRVPVHIKAVEDARHLEHEAVAALDTWRSEWASAVGGLGLDASASPAEANAVLDRLEELFKKVDEARAFKGRLKGIQRDEEAFAKEVGALVQAVAPDLAQRVSDQAVEMLQQRLASGKEDKATLLQLQKRIKELNAAVADSEAERTRADADLAALCVEAGCKLATELAEAERQSDEMAQLKSSLVAIEEQITELGGGAAVGALVSESEAVDPDALRAQIEELGRNATALDKQRSMLDRQIGSEQADFKRLDGSDAAADEAATAQTELAQLGSHVERYLRVKLAAELLRAEIERYREENQGPLLKRAGEIFSKLTLGSFSELGADYNDKDEPVLVGVRDDDERVHVDGMSEGTADQLYLSIRLATLEQHLATHEPIPFVVDDILVHFDDDRAFAALQVLAELSKKTQVLFFTHHAHLVELAEKLGDGVVAVHNLYRTEPA
jgi:uncharacterized protein YhaN